MSASGVCRCGFDFGQEGVEWDAGGVLEKLGFVGGEVGFELDERQRAAFCFKNLCKVVAAGLCAQAFEANAGDVVIGFGLDQGGLGVFSGLEKISAAIGFGTGGLEAGGQLAGGSGGVFAGQVGGQSFGQG